MIPNEALGAIVPANHACLHWLLRLLSAVRTFLMTCSMIFLFLAGSIDRLICSRLGSRDHKMGHLAQIILSLLYIAVAFSSPAEEYFEELDFAFLPNRYFSSTFKFLTNRRGPLGKHYDLFPKAIGEIVQRYGVEEFHLSLSQNFWRAYQWGYQPSPAAPTGAQLWAWFKENGTNEVDTQWRDFVHALSGLFCASFAQIDTRRLTIQPEHEFRPRGVLSEKSSGKAADNRYLRYAVLPSDNVCTENLTPWKKLLPCKSLAGIGSLLIGNKLFSGNYFALNIDLRRVCDSKRGESCSAEEDLIWELTQTLTVVFDARYSSIWSDWTLERLFGHTINSRCSVAKSSLIFVDTYKKAVEFVNGPYANAISNGNRRRYAVFDVQSIIETNGVVNIGARYGNHWPASDVYSPPPVYIHSFVAGSGLQSGRFVSRVYNTLDVTVPVLYSHTIPWFLRTYYHTLQIVCAGKIVKPRFKVYKPGRDRKRSHYFEIAFDAPPSRDSWCEVSIKFDRALLRYGEYPPDANHGFPVAAPMISFYDPTVANHTLLFTAEEPLLTFSSASGNGSKKIISKGVFTVVYGKSLLINLPTPDFSMPYNVICLVCTVVALAFGPIHSLTTKTLIFMDPAKIKKDKRVEIIKRFSDSAKERSSRVKTWFKTKVLRRKIVWAETTDPGTTSSGTGSLTDRNVDKKNN